MVEDEIRNIQKNVEKDLFEEQNKILDRFHSLITLTIAVSTLCLTFLTFMFGRGINNILETLRSYHVSLSFICMILAFLISIANVLATFRFRKLVNKGNIIGYREDSELVNNNLRLYLDVARRKNYYLIAITLIGLGLISLFNHFSRYHILTIIINIGFVTIIILLIYNSLRDLS